MDKFKCYECGQTFAEVKTIITHLQSVHLIKEKLNQIKCVNNFNKYACSKTYLTFASLRKHLEKCYSIGLQFELMVMKSTI